MKKTRVFLTFLYYVLLFCFPPVPAVAQTEVVSVDSVDVPSLLLSSTPASVVTLMTFVGDDLDLSAHLHDAVFTEIERIDGYIPQLVTALQYPESIRFHPDEPPAASYLGDSKYVLTGEYYVDLDEEMRHFQLWLWKSQDGVLVYTDELVAEDMAEAMSYMPALVTWVMSRIPEERHVTIMEQKPEMDINVSGTVSVETKQPEPPAVWEPPVKNPLHRWLYIGVRAGPSFRFYSLNDRISEYDSSFSQSLSYEFAFFVNFRFLDFVSFQGEIVFAADDAAFQAPEIIPIGANYRYIHYTDSFKSKSLTFPLLLKFPIEFSSFIIVPFGGAYFTLPLGKIKLETSDQTPRESGPFDYKLSFPLGITFGFDIGTPLGPGLFLFDFRFATDLGNTKIHNSTGFTYTRYNLSLSLGYEISFLERKPKAGK
jgi:hypothetical protein